MEMYNYTIIIPHKNTPRLLQRCLDSIPIRKDLYVIIVDDNSDSSIVDFNSFPGLNRKNTKVIFDKKNLGAGYVRNLGLNAINNTKWVFFSDADDYFTPYLNEALDKYRDDESDMVYFLMDSVYSETLQPATRHVGVNKRTNIAIATKDYDIIRYKAIEPVCKFISYRIIKNNNLKFEEVRYSNDVMFGIQVGSHIELLKIDLTPLYVATDRANSLIRTVKKDAIDCRYYVAIRASKYLKSIGKYKYHTNLFSYCYLYNKINTFLGIKCFFLSLKNTSIDYWWKDIKQCFDYLFNK